MVFLYVLLFLLVFPSIAYAYLDPGTGSYVFQVVVAMIFGAGFAIKIFWKKLRNILFHKNDLKEDSN